MKSVLLRSGLITRVFFRTSTFSLGHECETLISRTDTQRLYNVLLKMKYIFGIYTSFCPVLEAKFDNSAFIAETSLSEKVSFKQELFRFADS